MIRFLKYFAVLSIILLGTIYFLLTTHQGLRLTLSLVEKFVPGKLQVDHIKGTLTTGFKLENLTYLDDTNQVSIKSMQVSWDLSHIWRKKIIIKDLYADMIRYHGTGENKSYSSNIPSLPLGMKIDLKRIHVKHFSYLKKDQQLFLVDDLSLLENANKVYFVTVRTLNGHISGNLAFDNENDFSWKIELIGEQLNPGLIAKDWNGEINFSLNSDGKWIENNKQINLTLHRINGKVGQFPLEGTSLIYFSNGEFTIKKSELTIANAFAKFTGNIARNWNIHWQVHVPDLNVIDPKSKGELTSSGKITGDYTHPKIEADLNAILPQVKKLKLHFLSTINLQNNFSVIANVSDGEAVINKLGIHLEKINLQSHYEKNKPIYFDGHFISGKGDGTISGNFDFHQNNYPLNLKLDGEGLTVIKLADYKIKASPHLTASFIENSLTLNGKIFIPKAKIKPKDFSSVTTLPNDVVFVDQAQAQENVSLPTNISMNVNIVLGDDISFTYENLRTNLKGEVTITQQIGSLPVGIGELIAVNGKYQAYGKLLKISQGRIIYTGNLITNPGLDVRAVQEIKTFDVNNQSQFTNNDDLKSISQEKIIVGVWVKGTLNNPIISLFSEPGGLANADIISYLVFGAPQSKVKDYNSLSLLNSLASNINMGGKGAVNGATKKN